jgi:hypothetical protein
MLAAVLRQNVFFTKIIQERSHHPPETIATKSKPECAAECEQKVLPMIVAVAANVCGTTQWFLALRKNVSKIYE